MPIHPAFADHLHLLDGLPPLTEGGPDPEAIRRFQEYQRATGSGAPAAVDTRTDTAPGPHGPVPVRIYGPGGPDADRPCLVWLHGIGSDRRGRGRAVTGTA